MGGSGRQGITQSTYQADSAAVGAFGAAVFGPREAVGSAKLAGTGPVYGAQPDRLLSLGRTMPTDPSWSADKKAAFMGLQNWGWDYYQPMPQALYSYLRGQSRNPAVSRVLEAIDPQTRAWRPEVDAERRRRLLQGG